jgi:hypothetical protein
VGDASGKAASEDGAAPRRPDEGEKVACPVRGDPSLNLADHTHVRLAFACGLRAATASRADPADGIGARLRPTLVETTEATAGRPADPSTSSGAHGKGAGACQLEEMRPSQAPQAATATPSLRHPGDPCLVCTRRAP